LPEGQDDPAERGEPGVAVDIAGFLEVDGDLGKKLSIIRRRSSR